MTANFSKASYRMYPTAQAASHPVEVEATYFVEHRNHDIYLNDEPLDYPTTEALAMHLVLTRDYPAAETLPGSGVYRLTVAELRNIRNLAQAVLQSTQEAQGKAQAHTPVYFDTGACGVSVCADCALDCEAVLGVQMAADWQDQRVSESYPWQN